MQLLHAHEDADDAISTGNDASTRCFQRALVRFPEQVQPTRVARPPPDCSKIASILWYTITHNEKTCVLLLRFV